MPHLTKRMTWFANPLTFVLILLFKVLNLVAKMKQLAIMYLCNLKASDSVKNENVCKSPFFLQNERFSLN